MEDKLPEIDVIVLSWNRAESTIDTVKNILDQINVKVNIWLIDQGSDNSQIEILREFIKSNKMVQMVEVGKNLGVPGGRNLGMKLGKSEFIVCIDNDAIFESKQGIENVIKKFIEEENIAVIGFKIKNFFTRTLDYTSWAYAKKLIQRQDEEFLTTRFCGAGHAIRRSILKKTDFYDQALFFYWEELDLSYQMINLGYKICYFPDIEILHKVSPEKKFLWGKKRFYYLVRNAIYLNWKYYRSVLNIFNLSIGYLIKGIHNGLFGSTFHGILDSYKMIFRLKPLKKFILTKSAREYIYCNDIAYRGSIFSRLMNDVFTKLPAIK